MLKRKLLVLDASFSYEAIVNRSLESSVTCRDLNGYFEHVWSVHPFASLVTSPEWNSVYGKPVSYLVNKSNTFIEGKVGRYLKLKKFSSLNFAISQLSVIYFLIKLINKEKISVIRVGDPLILGLMGYLLSKITGVPFLVRVGANNEKIRKSTGNRMMPRLFKSVKQEQLIEKFVLSRADMVAGANEDNLNFAIYSGAKPEKCTLFRYGNLINEAHFIEPFKRISKPDDLPNAPFILTIARLEIVKKVEDVIRVLAKVRESGIEIKALIVGDGRERQKMEELAEKLNVLNDVIFCGNKDQNWLASVIPLAEVVISPHTGRALTEAALGGAPIAAYDVDWQKELIESGVTGEIVKYGDWEQLAKATIKLIVERNYALKVGQNVRIKALEMMDPNMLNSHEIKIYDYLINKSVKSH